MFHVLVLVEKMMGQAWQVRILPEQGGTLCLVIPEGGKVISVIYPDLERGIV